MRMTTQCERHHLSRSGGVQKIVLNSPEKLNALTVDMGEQFKTVIAELNGMQDLRWRANPGATLATPNQLGGAPCDAHNSPTASIN